MPVNLSTGALDQQGQEIGSGDKSPGTIPQQSLSVVITGFVEMESRILVKG